MSEEESIMEGLQRGRRRRLWIPFLGVTCVVVLLILPNCTGKQPFGTEPVAPPTVNDAVYVGWQTCLECHEREHKAMERTLHGKVLATGVSRTDLQRHGCESCHGPGSKHVQDPTDPDAIIKLGPNSTQPAQAQNAMCLQCHTKGKLNYWQGSPHEVRDVSCTSCHSVHASKTLKANLTVPTQFQLCGQCHQVATAQSYNWAHLPIREGKMQCADCHNVHGTITEKLIPENSINENCYRCHADIRGPFLWEHPPVRENCMNCHVPHGGNNVRLLRLRSPRICQECHNESGHPSTAFSNLADRRIIGRNCLTCHMNIHGSNHPSGFALTR
jgi:DmsE family decaheme c-type cytochrome